MKEKIKIIAEAGVNHDGCIDTALELIEVAAKSGADAVKFQTYVTDDLVTKNAPKAEYQKISSGTREKQHELLKRLELSFSEFKMLRDFSIKNKIQFLSTAFDSKSLKFLVNELDLPTLKIASGELTNGPFLLEHATTGRDILLSTGMATIGEIEEALGVLAFGLYEGEQLKTAPSLRAFHEAYNSKEGQNLLKQKVTLLHCTTQYPTPINQINLNAMCRMHDTFGLRVGYSDHSQGIVVPVAAAALGALVIEKHFTLNSNNAGPDHASSLNPSELTNMVEAVRSVELALGNGVKFPNANELENRLAARKSLVATSPIALGEKYSHETIAAKRPGSGKSPMRYWDMMGRPAKKALDSDECL